MPDRNNMGPDVDLRLLQDIRAEYETQAATIGVILPAFDAQGRTGNSLLLAYRDYLKILPKSVNGFGCDPECAGGSCPPCDDWGGTEYRRFRLHLQLSNSTDMQLLQDILKEYQRLAVARQALNRAFTIPAFDETQFEGLYENAKLFRYLKTVAFHFSDKVGCDPHCQDGSCPPCEGWGRAQYEAFLQKLKALPA